MGFIKLNVCSDSSKKDRRDPMIDDDKTGSELQQI